MSWSWILMITGNNPVTLALFHIAPIIDRPSSFFKSILVNGPYQEDLSACILCCCSQKVARWLIVSPNFEVIPNFAVVKIHYTHSSEFTGLASHMDTNGSGFVPVYWNYTEFKLLISWLKHLLSNYCIFKFRIKTVKYY